MEIKKTTIKNAGIISIITIVGILGLVALFSGRENNLQSNNSNDILNTDGKQIITLTAKSGYSPSVIKAKANQDIILRVVTKNTFDCSSAISIPKLGVQKNLPATGKTDIAIAAQTAGSEIDVICSMGMYHSKIEII